MMEVVHSDTASGRNWFATGGTIPGVPCCTRGGQSVPHRGSTAVWMPGTVNDLAESSADRVEEENWVEHSPAFLASSTGSHRPGNKEDWEAVEGWVGHPSTAAWFPLYHED